MLNKPLITIIYRTIPLHEVSMTHLRGFRMTNSNLFLNHLTVSSRLILWLAPTWVWHRRRLATRSPGRVLESYQHHILHYFQFPLYSHASIEIHAVDTNSGVVLDSQIDVLADTETEVASLREVALSELIFLDLQSTLQDFLGLRATDSDVNSDLLVTTDTEGSDGVSGLACLLCIRTIDFGFLEKRA
jgi:hypothetical protein